MKLVKQEDAFGCGVACLATILEKSYADVRKDFENDFSKKGISFDRLIDYLASCGYEVVKKEVLGWDDVSFTHREMLKPFAPVHIVNVQPSFDSKNRHSVVMDAKGKLYCPHGNTDQEIRDVYAVHEAAGFWK